MDAGSRMRIGVFCIKDRWGIRKLTPRECARLQGYEDSWFRLR